MITLDFKKFATVAVYWLDLSDWSQKRWGTIELCSIGTLLKITSAFYKLFFHREYLVKVTLIQGSTVKINSLLYLF
jgi:hypothetical protein